MTVPALSDLLVGLTPATGERKLFVTGAISMRFGELADSVARTRTLLTEHGVGPGDRVAVVTADELAVCRLYGACLLSGAVAVMVDPDASASEINVLLAKARVSMVFADPAVVDRAGALQADDSVPVITVAPAEETKTGFGLLIRRKKARQGGDAPSAPAVTYPSMLTERDPDLTSIVIDEDAPALMLFTSGTTSQPKGVVLTRRNLAAQIVTFANQYGFDSNSVIGNHLPLHHTDGINQGVLLAMAYGSTWIRPGDVDMHSLGDVLDQLYRNNATHLITVPTVIAMMTRLPAAYDDLFSGEQFQFISSTAGYLDPAIWTQVEERFNTMIVNSYGLTETVSEALYCGPSEHSRRIGTIGKPVDCDARIVDEDGNDVAPGEIGELWLRGDNIMAGYFELPEATAAVLTDDGWLRTGDLAQLVDGFYTIAGRKKNVIIRGGINVYPEDVNSALLASPKVSAAATVGVPDSFLGELVVTCVALSDPSIDDPTTELMELCRQELADEKVPNRILVVDELPYGPSGKVELAKVTQTAVEALGGAIEGGTAGEQVLEVAAQVFGHSVDDLSDGSTPDSTPGWDSLTFLELIVRLERQFDMAIAPRDVMTMGSLGDAIALVESR